MLQPISIMPGYKQSLGCLRDPKAANTDSESVLQTHLLWLWTLGDISAIACQKIAHSAFLDGLKHPAVAKLASCGSWGQHPNNVSRDLERMVVSESKASFAEPTIIKDCPCSNPRRSEEETTDVAFFDPCNTVAALQESPEHFQSIFQPDGLHEFWNNVRPDDPRLTILMQESSLKHEDLPATVPLWVHGDGVEYADGKTMMVYSWGSVLNSGPSLSSSLLLLAFPKDCAVSATWETLWSHIVPSFSKLQAGKTDIVHNYRFTIWQVMGDQEFFANVLKLPHWMNAQPCWECKMTGPQQQSNLDKDIEGWRLPQEEMNCRISAHPLFTIHGVSHFNIAQDAMHILFCKGVLSHCMGNALKFWCYTCKAVPGRSIRDKVKHILQKNTVALQGL